MSKISERTAEEWAMQARGGLSDVRDMRKALRSGEFGAFHQEQFEWLTSLFAKAQDDARAPLLEKIEKLCNVLETIGSKTSKMKIEHLRGIAQGALLAIARDTE